MEEELKLCSNCNRDIPAINFMTHTVHCARNIRVCPVCKEPIPISELDDHHDKMHKMMPCKQCGESVCGTDLEDHIRDSCALTVKSCRFCELELPRRELPAHESYCGVRTEQCAQCGEWVMIKYRQIHLDSNHGFLRLDDDPPPPRKEPPKTIVTKFADKPSINYAQLRLRPSSSRNVTNADSPIYSAVLPENSVDNSQNSRNGLTSQSAPEPSARSGHNPTNPGPSSSKNLWPSDSLAREAISNNLLMPERRAPPKRNNTEAQINTAVRPINKINKDLHLARGSGAVKKRAPPPPPDLKRDNAYRSAARRQHQEEHERAQLNAYNAAMGLPPVLNPAQKLEKLRKLDALQNWEFEPKIPPRESPRQQGNGTVNLQGLKPMSIEQFRRRMENMALEERREETCRFDEIKSSLRELRRGLNEVTAPYNTGQTSGSSSTNTRSRPSRSSSRSPNPPGPTPGADTTLNGSLDVELPCEFCSHLVHAENLVLHQSGCRGGGAGAGAATPPVEAEPLLPCEFCGDAVPESMLLDHQIECQDSSRCCHSRRSCRSCN